jgi:hypothetical protein
MNYLSTTPQDLLSEFFSVIEEKSEVAISLTCGALKGLELETRANAEPPRLEIEWILRAQIGTIEKLKTLLSKERLPSSLELISAARNLFEIIVWLKLFEDNYEWGGRFYGIFLKENLDDISGLLQKVESEIALFERAQAEDENITNSMIAELAKAISIGSDTTAIITKHNRLRETLDQKVRRSFSLYAAASKFNGYTFQIHHLREKEIPRILEWKKKIEAQREDFRKWTRSISKFNDLSKMIRWRREAKSVGLEGQYDYLYRLSSRLLHSGPMSIITEKALTDQEQMVLLEYMVVAVRDVFELVERFDFPGRLSMFYVETD